MNNHFKPVGIAVLLGVGLALTLAAGVLGSGSRAGRHYALCRARRLWRRNTVLCDDPGRGRMRPRRATRVRIAAGAYTGVSSRAGIETGRIRGQGACTLRGGFTTANWATPNPVANQTTVRRRRGLGRGAGHLRHT